MESLRDPIAGIKDQNHPPKKKKKGAGLKEILQQEKAIDEGRISFSSILAVQSTEVNLNQHLLFSAIFATKRNPQLTDAWFWPLPPTSYFIKEKSMKGTSRWAPETLPGHSSTQTPILLKNTKSTAPPDPPEGLVWPFPCLLVNCGGLPSTSKNSSSLPKKVS